MGPPGNSPGPRGLCPPCTAWDQEAGGGGAGGPGQRAQQGTPPLTALCTRGSRDCVEVSTRRGWAWRGVLHSETWDSCLLRCGEAWAVEGGSAPQPLLLAPFTACSTGLRRRRQPGLSQELWLSSLPSPQAAAKRFTPASSSLPPGASPPTVDLRSQGGGYNPTPRAHPAHWRSGSMWRGPHAAQGTWAAGSQQGPGGPQTIMHFWVAARRQCEHQDGQ